MVYPENLSSGALVDEHMSSMDFDSDYADSEMEWEEEIVDQGNKSSDDPCFNDVQILDNASLLLSTKIKNDLVFDLNGLLLLQISLMDLSPFKTKF